MSEHLKLKAEDGHELDAYVARPVGAPIAGLVVIQEIFGVNPHIRSVADGYAKDGFLAAAPAMFDRYERGVEIGYEGDDMKKPGLLAQARWGRRGRDVGAALDMSQGDGKEVGNVGYCFGGLLRGWREPP